MGQCVPIKRPQQQQRQQCTKRCPSCHSRLSTVLKKRRLCSKRFNAWHRMCKLKAGRQPAIQIRPGCRMHGTHTMCQMQRSLLPHRLTTLCTTHLGLRRPTSLSGKTLCERCGVCVVMRGWLYTVVTVPALLRRHVLTKTLCGADSNLDLLSCSHLNMIFNSLRNSA